MNISEILSVTKGGSGRLGITTTTTLFECPRKFELTQRHGSKPNVAMMRGSIGHLFLEHFYAQKELPTVSVDPDDEWADEWAKMWKCFRWYRGKFDPREFGKPRGVEDRYPRTEAHENALNRCIYPDYSLAMDLVVLPTERQIERLNRTHDVVLLPGLWYIVDHKFTTHFSREWILDKVYSFQMRTYETAFKALFPKRPFGGCIINGVNYKEPYGRKLVHLEPMDEDQQLAHRHVKWELQNLLDLPSSERLDMAMPTPGHCIYPSPCQFLGKCGAHGKASI